MKPQHILTGAVMSAPAAIAIAKLNWPEVDESVFRDDKEFQLKVQLVIGLIHVKMVVWNYNVVLITNLNEPSLANVTDAENIKKIIRYQWT